MAKAAQRMNKKHQAQWEESFRQAKQLIDLSRLQEAKQLCEQLLSTYGDNSDLLNLMGVIHYRGGDPGGAIGWYKRLLDNDPANTEALLNLANLLTNLGYRQQAMEMYESVLTHNPQHTGALKALNRLCFQEGKMEMSFLAGARLVALESCHDDTWDFMHRAIPHLPPQAMNQDFLDKMSVVLDNPACNWYPALRLSLQAIGVNAPALVACLQLIGSGGDKALDDVPTKDLQRILNIPILHKMLRRYVIPLPTLERLLTMLRRRFLAMLDENGGEGLEAYCEELLSLAYQAHVNEYVYYQTPEEKERIAVLGAEIEASEASLPKLLLFFCYCSPSSLNNAQMLPEIAKKLKDKAFRSFITVAVSEILEEREIAKTIPIIAMGEDKISMAVREQYEENPYPRWMGMGDIPAEHTGQVLRRLFPRFDQSQVEMSDKPEILIAGCGTGKHGVGVARRFKDSHVTAVDLSRASLAYGIRKSREYGIRNIDYCQADILKLETLNRSFDIVESCGVLHHMSDPMEGWRILTDLTKPGGLIKIGLYSSTARRELTAMRVEIKAKGYGDSADEIRRFRHDMMDNEQMHSRYPFTLAGDFYGLSECRDLLFHRQEHCFSLPQLKECIKSLGLIFMGFEMTNVELLERYIQRFPEELYWNDLDNWHMLEQERPLSFFGMYQFWCYKPL